MNIRYFEKRGHIWLDFKDSGGKRHRVPTTAVTEAQARVLAPQVVADRLNKPSPAATFPQLGSISTLNAKAGVTLEEAFKVASVNRAKWLQAKDKQAKQHDFDGLCTAPGLSKDADMSLLTRDNLLAARAHWMKQPGKRKGTTLAPSTINHRLSMASVLLEECRLLPHNVKFLSVEGNRRKRRVRSEELEAVVQWCTANHARKGALAMADLVLVGLHTTARLGELLSVVWGDVYFDRDVFVVRDPKNGSHRDAHLNTTAKVILQRRKLLGGTGPFTDLSRWQAGALWRGAKEAMGLANDHEFVFHVATRHEGLSRLGDSGENTYTIKAYGGHKTTAASDRYVHPGAIAMKRAGAAIVSNSAQNSD
jgi:integrase